MMLSKIGRWVWLVSGMVFVSFGLRLFGDGLPPIAITNDEAQSISQVWDAELKGATEEEYTLAKALSVTGSPHFTIPWAKGALNRLGSLGRPIDIKFAAIDGRYCDLSKMRGKVVLIHFWATWCPPCVQGMPKLSTTYALYRSKGLRILGVSWDADRLALNRFIKKSEIEWPIFSDGQRPGRWGIEYGVGGVPYVLLVDRIGNLRYFGADENYAIDVMLPKLIASP